jgi:hypothetical protein
MLALVGCSGLHFSKVAYDADISIEKKTGELLARTSDSYTTHVSEVEALRKGNSGSYRLGSVSGNDKAITLELSCKMKASNS